MYGTGSTIPLVKTQNGISFEYVYDSRGNIISEKRGSLTTTYAYDALGQLIRVNDPHENATWVYNYDRGGNILSKVRYDYTTSALGTIQQTIPYGYDDTNWKDKLTSYDGQTITYDAIGNPLNDGTWIYTWNTGRQLKQMSKSDTTVQFKYDHNGLRVGKIVNGTEIKYILHGKLIAHMTCGSDNLHFFYDAQSRPAMVEWNGKMFGYVHNLQGDIVAILDSAGNKVVEYQYDAWGRDIGRTLTSDIGELNPFRYRGYVYDGETELYYLRSRYYNPGIGRFVSADSFSIITTDSYRSNLFIYCNDCPATSHDMSGLRPMSAISLSAETKIERQQSFSNIKRSQTELQKNCYFLDASTKKTSESLPYYGKKGDPQTLLNPDGTPKQKRWYGSDSRPEHDRDYNHPGDMDFPHDHDWKDGKRDKEHKAPNPDYKIDHNPVAGIGLVLACCIGLAVVAIDDVTGLGAADDVLYAPLSGGVATGLSMIFG